MFFSPSPLFYPSFLLNSRRALPPGIELSAAESVRFTGCAVRVLTSPRGAFAGRELLPETEVQEAAAAVGQLAAAPVFDSAAFASAIERLRSLAALRLWELVVKDAELPAHLDALRRYFLMGRVSLRTHPPSHPPLTDLRFAPLAPPFPFLPVLSISPVCYIPHIQQICLIHRL